MNFTAIYPHISILQIIHHITLCYGTVMTLYYTEFIKHVCLTDG